MARQERPVDPAAGPLQSFAHDLRRVRARAGNPTYRALAKVAGYSATTLSEAARGVRKPTLDVVLAYVGACRGDVDAWRRRWEELDWPTAGQAHPAVTGGQAHLTATADGDRPGTTGADEDVGEPDVGTPAPDLVVPPASGTVPPMPRAIPRRGNRRRRPWRLLAAVATAAFLVVSTAFVVALLVDEPVVRTTNGMSCPTLPVHRAFTGVTYGNGAPVHTGASVNDPLVSMVPSNCTLGFTGFCVGERVADATAGTPDVRWFVLADGNVVPSAVIHGNPPASMRPTRCRGERPAPDAIELRLTVDPAAPGAVRARASGRNLEIVGFAAWHAPDATRPGAAQWRQLRLAAGVDLGSTWRTGRSADPSTTGRVVVVAAACLGGGGPTDVVDVKAVRLDKSTITPYRLSLPARESAAAARVACQYPH